MASSTFYPGSSCSGPRGARSGPRSEDAQPNESVNRRQRLPPTVNSAAHNRRSWWAGRGPNRPPVTHHNLQSVVRERTGSTRRAPPPSISAYHAVSVSHARPHSLPTTSGTGWQNTALPPIDPRPRQPRQDHSASTSSMPTSESPVPKRQKLVGCAGVEVKREIPTESMAALSVSPVSSETLVSDHKVKVERAITPELCSKPQLSTSGSKRYAPLPPECRKTHPNHSAARTAWARKEQEALRRLGLRVVRTFIREDGMVIDWEAIDSELTDTAAVIERALLLNDASIRSSFATSPLISTSHRRHLPDGENDGLFTMESLKGPVEDLGADASRMRSPPRNPGMDRRSQSPMHVDTGEAFVAASVHTPAPIAYFPKDLRDAAVAPTAALPLFSSSSRYTHSPMLHQTTNALLHPSSSQGRMRESRSQSSHDSSTSPRPVVAPPPSQNALNALHHILQIKRQISRSSSSTGPSAVSPSPSCPPYAAPKEQQTKTPLKRPAESSADVVAAAINESSRLSQGGALASSTPLRVYKKRRSIAATLLRGKGKDTVPARDEPRQHRERDSSSSERPLSPPIAVLGPTGSILGSPLTELTPSVSGDECDELDLSYPPSPGMISHLPSAEEPPDPPRQVEPTEPVEEPSFLNYQLPSPEETAAMQSAALQYLHRYGQTFDTDRRALAGAYTHNAAFSCPSRGLRTQGRDDTVNALTTLDGALCSNRNVEYDVSRPVPGIGVMLVVLGTMICAQGDREVGYTMSFVLLLRDHEDGRSTGDWPLVAAMHQMVLREGS